MEEKLPGEIAKIATVLPPTISECALKSSSGVCVSRNTLSTIASTVGASGVNPQQTMEIAKKRTDCGTIRCVLNKLENRIGENVVRRELETNFKIPGPINSNLLSNKHIDSTLQQWMKHFEGFFAHPFAMRNYAKYSYVNGRVKDEPCTLHTMNAGHMRDKGITTIGCVINTDYFQGRGKHWMALFADMRKDGHWTVEFFNSSGNPPYAEYAAWLTKTKIELENSATAKEKKPTIEIVTVTKKHQVSRSECGPYSLFYIWSRLNDVPAQVFQTTRIPDSIMFEFRQHLFDDPAHSDVAQKQFSWDAIKRKVGVDWEHSRGDSEMVESFSSWASSLAKST